MAVGFDRTHLGGYMAGTPGTGRNGGFGVDKWQEYEQEKRALLWEDLTPEEYYDRLQEIVSRLGI